MSVEVLNETDYQIDGLEFQELADYVLSAMHVSPEAEMSLIFVEPDVIAALHERWLDLEGPTDVMSFPLDELRPGSADSPTEAGILGDIVICPEVAQAQAVNAGHSSTEEMLLLTVHGMLHLLGYDHAEKEEEKEMFGLQEEILTAYGLTRQ